MFTIYSIGDAAYLGQVLNAVAMLAGTGNFGQAISIGLLLGVIFSLFQSISQNGGKEVPWITCFLATLIYMLAFGPKAEVIVEDAYTGEVRSIDNVPFGVAAAGSIISQIGYGLTEQFEQAFSTPSSTHHGFGGGLESLRRVRNIASNRTKYVNGNDPSGNGQSDFYESWTQYVTDCTATGVISKQQQPTGTLMSGQYMLSAPKFMDALLYPNKNAGTQIAVGSGWVEKDCVEAHAELVSFTIGTFYPHFMNTAVAHALRLRDGNAAEIAIQDALDNFGLSSITAKDYIITGLLEPIYARGWLVRYQNDQAWTYASMIEDAMRQRQVQWSGESALFLRALRPMTTILEGFAFAVTPIMAFVLAMGRVEMAAKYGLLLIWIQLWNPLLAIANLYVVMVVKGEMGGLTGAGNMAITSLSGMLSADSTVQQWLATGEMMVAATPALAWMLIYGSAVTATSLASRMQGGDFVDEKRVAQDTINAVPFIQNSSPHVFSANEGMTLHGASGALPKFELMSQTSGSVESARTAALETSRNFMHSLGQRVTSTTGTGVRGGSSDYFATHHSGELGQADQTALDIARSVVQRHMGSETVQSNTVARMGAEAGMSFIAGKGGGAGGLGAKGGFSGAIAQEYGVGKQVAESIEKDLRQAFTNGSSQSLRVSDSAAHDIRDGKENYFTREMGVSADRDLREQASQTVSKGESYRNTVSAMQSGAIVGRYEGATVAERLSKMPQLRTELGQRAAELGLGGAVETFMRSKAGSEMVKELSGNEDKGWDLARLMALRGSLPGTRTLDPQRRALGADAAMGIIGKAFGMSTSDIGSAARNEGIGAGAPEIGAIPALVKPGTAAAAALPGGSQIVGGAAALEARIGRTQGAAGDGAVDAKVGEYRQQATTKAVGQEKEILKRQGQAFDKQAGNVLDQGSSGGAWLSRQVEAMKGDVGRTWDVTAGVVKGYGETYRQSWMAEFNQARHAGLTPIQASAFAEERMAAGYGRDIRAAVAPIFGPDPRDVHRENLRTAVAAEAGNPRVHDLIKEAALNPDGRGLSMVAAENERRDRVAELNGSRLDWTPPQQGWQPVQDGQGRLQAWRTEDGKDVPAAQPAAPAHVGER